MTTENTSSPSEQNEQVAQAIWEHRLTGERDALSATVRKYAFTEDEMVGLEWDMLPDAVQDDIRQIAQSREK